MMIRGRLSFRGETASVITGSLEPDNPPEIETCKTSVVFSADKISTMLSSIDDYLMNAIIAEKLYYLLKEDFTEKH